MSHDAVGAQERGAIQAASYGAQIFTLAARTADVGALQHGGFKDIAESEVGEESGDAHRQEGLLVAVGAEDLVIKHQLFQTGLAERVETRQHLQHGTGNT